MGIGVPEALLGLGLGLALWGCGSPPAPTPSAVIRTCPSAVCVGDEFNTSIHLDATKSTPILSLVPVPPDPNAPPLSLRWSFAGSARQITDGVATDPEILVTMKGDRPLHVSLRVENAEGGVAEETRSIAITPLDADGNCPLPEPDKDLTGDCPDIGTALSTATP